MPSRFEPCGLSQMYAQRFGSLPIGHQTGGLAETIADGETGFLFAQPSAESFLGGVRRAFDAYRAKDRLNAMRASAMAKSYSWDLSAACYSALYRTADHAALRRNRRFASQACEASTLWDPSRAGNNCFIRRRTFRATHAAPMAACLDDRARMKLANDGHFCQNQIAMEQHHGCQRRASQFIHGKDDWRLSVPRMNASLMLLSATSSGSTRRLRSEDR